MKSNEMSLIGVYEAPQMKIINIEPEGVLCESFGEKDGPDDFGPWPGD